MYWPNAVSFQCGSCNKVQTYQNPGRHSLSLVTWKAFRDGWHIPNNGVHLCPDCRNKLDAKVALPMGYGKTETTLAHFNEVDQLSLPPVLVT